MLVLALATVAEPRLLPREGVASAVRKQFEGVLSLLLTGQLLTALEHQCRRRGVEVIHMAQSWSTRLAERNQFPDRYRFGVHHAAELVIARRGLGFAERVPKTARPPCAPK